MLYIRVKKKLNMINGGLQARHCKKDGHVAISPALTLKSYSPRESDLLHVHTLLHIKGNYSVCSFKNPINLCNTASDLTS